MHKQYQCTDQVPPGEIMIAQPKVILDENAPVEVLVMFHPDDVDTLGGTEWRRGNIAEWVRIINAHRQFLGEPELK